jgi:hypothetical protein
MQLDGPPRNKDQHKSFENKVSSKLQPEGKGYLQHHNKLQFSPLADSVADELLWKALAAQVKVFQELRDDTFKSPEYQEKSLLKLLKVSLDGGRKLSGTSQHVYK